MSIEGAKLDVAGSGEAAGTPSFRALPLQPELAILVCGAAAYFLFPEDLGFITQIFVDCVFVLSLGLVLGQAGISSVGHATFFGAGAYAAGLFAIHISGDPLLGLIAGAVSGGVVAAISGLVILRAYGTALVVLTAALAQLVAEIANKARAITGGADGLGGFQISPMLGRFAFDAYGKTGFVYALAILVGSYFVLRKIVASPFGLTCRAIRSEHRRMPLLGCNVYLHLLAVFTIGGIFAGMAGSLEAQTTGIVGLSTLGFGLSAMAIVMLVLGGTRRLPGAILGTVTFLVIQRIASTVNPAYWLFAVGALLILTLTFVPNGLMQIVDRVAARAGRGTARRNTDRS